FISMVRGHHIDDRLISEADIAGMLGFLPAYEKFRGSPAPEFHFDSLFFDARASTPAEIGILIPTQKRVNEYWSNGKMFERRAEKDCGISRGIGTVLIPEALRDSGMFPGLPIDPNFSLSAKKWSTLKTAIQQMPAPERRNVVFLWIDRARRNGMLSTRERLD